MNEIHECPLLPRRCGAGQAPARIDAAPAGQGRKAGISERYAVISSCLFRRTYARVTLWT